MIPEVPYGEKPLTGAELIMLERGRHERLGWTAEYDDATHTRWQLTRAAIFYLREAKGRKSGSEVPREWPWDDSAWRPSERIDDLVKAGALISAEIDRLLRAGYTHGRT